MRLIRTLPLLLLMAVTLAIGQTRATNTLDIYVIDVEGGNAVLLVPPSKESLLIDTGNAGAAAVRDVNRIMDAIKDAGLTQIDHLITTHWHSDHFGGLQELAARVSNPTRGMPRIRSPWAFMSRLASSARSI